MRFQKNRFFLFLFFFSLPFFLLAMISCQIPSRKQQTSIPSPISPPSLPTTKTKSPPTLSQRPRRQFPANPGGRPTVYCEGDFFDYQDPQQAFLGLTLQFIYDQKKKFEMVLINQQEQVLQRLSFRILRKESLKLAQTHGNQTLIISHPLGLHVAGIPKANRAMVLIPLKELDANESQSTFASFSFQNLQGDYIGGNQKLNCSFDTLPQ